MDTILLMVLAMVSHAEVGVGVHMGVVVVMDMRPVVNIMTVVKATQLMAALIFHSMPAVGEDLVPMQQAPVVELPFASSPVLCTWRVSCRQTGQQVLVVLVVVLVVAYGLMQMLLKAGDHCLHEEGPALVIVGALAIQVVAVTTMVVVVAGAGCEPTVTAMQRKCFSTIAVYRAAQPMNLVHLGL